jgi:hypothetical protein
MKLKPGTMVRLRSSDEDRMMMITELLNGDVARCTWPREGLDGERLHGVETFRLADLEKAD